MANYPKMWKLAILLYSLHYVIRGGQSDSIGHIFNILTAISLLQSASKMPLFEYLNEYLMKTFRFFLIKTMNT